MCAAVVPLERALVVAGCFCGLWSHILCHFPSFAHGKHTWQRSQQPKGASVVELAYFPPSIPALLLHSSLQHALEQKVCELMQHFKLAWGVTYNCWVCALPTARMVLLWCTSSMPALLLNSSRKGAQGKRWARHKAALALLLNCFDD
jgi:hypothetical protein